MHFSDFKGIAPVVCESGKISALHHLATWERLRVLKLAVLVWPYHFNKGKHNENYVGHFQKREYFGQTSANYEDS